MSKRLWCGIYLASVALLIMLMIIAAIVGMLSFDEVLAPNYLAVAVGPPVLGYLQFIVVHTVATLVLLFTMWKALEDGITPVTAGKAVGYLFIPFFNIYWFFRVWGGYPSEYNKYLQRHRLNAPPLNGGIFLAFAVTVGLTVLIIPILVLPFVTVFLIARGYDAISNLELAKSAAAGQPVSSPLKFVGTPENPRSKMPVIALGGVAAVALLGVLGFGIFAWFNLHPNLSADELPATVGDFRLESPGRADGSFFGRKFAALDNIYLSETGGARQAIRYNIFQYPTETRASERIISNCKPSTSATALQDQQGKEAGHFCIDGGAVWMQIGRYFLWAHKADGYQLEKLKAKEPSLDSVVKFAKGLPLFKDIVFPDGKLPAAPATTTTADSNKSDVAVSSTTPADFSLTGKEFYDETNGNFAAAKAKYKGKTVQITSRVALTSGGSVMMNAGTSSIFAYYSDRDSSVFEALKRDDRVVVKCAVEAEYSIKLNQCVLVENKGIISPTDAPDVTFTAEEYWKSVASTDVSVDARIKKQNELSGKIIKITGKVKDLAGTKHYLAAGDGEFPCYPDDENAGAFSSLTEGQTVTVLAVGGSSLSHCLLIGN